MAEKRKFIQKARAKMEEEGTVGLLRKKLGAKEGKAISAKKLEKAAHSDNKKLKKEAVFAENMRKIAKNRKKG